MAEILKNTISTTESSDTNRIARQQLEKLANRFRYELRMRRHRQMSTRSLSELNEGDLEVLKDVDIISKGPVEISGNRVFKLFRDEKDHSLLGFKIIEKEEVDKPPLG